MTCFMTWNPWGSQYKSAGHSAVCEANLVNRRNKPAGYLLTEEPRPKAYPLENCVGPGSQQPNYKGEETQRMTQAVGIFGLHPNWEEPWWDDWFIFLNRISNWYTHYHYERERMLGWLRFRLATIEGGKFLFSKAVCKVVSPSLSQ